MERGGLMGGQGSGRKKLYDENGNPIKQQAKLKGNGQNGKRGEFDPTDPPVKSKGWYYRRLQKLGAEHFPYTADGANEILDRYYEINDEFGVEYTTAETMALAFGVTVPTLKRWLTGGNSRWTQEALQVIALAYMSSNAEATDRLLDNKANTAGAIFLLKNNWGYMDTQTVQFESNVMAEEEKVDVLSLKSKYAEYLDEGQGLDMLPETSVTSALRQDEIDRQKEVDEIKKKVGTRRVENPNRHDTAVMIDDLLSRDSRAGGDEDET